MQRVAVVTALLLTLAGCSDDGAGRGQTDVDPIDAGPLENGTDAPPVPEPVPTVVDVGFGGNLGTSFYACEYETTGTCQGQEATADETDLYLEQSGATLVAADLSLTWSATSPATDTLGFGLMRMGDNSTLVQNVEGTSPLRLNVTDLDLLLDDANLVHVYVYNVRGLLHNPPVAGYATVDQAFSVEGSLTMRVAA